MMVRKRLSQNFLLEVPTEFPYTNSMKNKNNTNVDLSKYVVFIPVKNDDVLTALTETLGDAGDDFNTIFGDDYVIVPHDREEEILGLIEEITSDISEDEEQA